MDLPVSGHLYICGSCLGQAAVHLGWLEPRVAKDLREQLRLSEELRREQQLELERAKGQGSWTWTADVEESLGVGDLIFEPNEPGMTVSIDDPTVCPDCGGKKGAESKTCRPCSAKRALAARGKQIAAQVTG